MRVLVLVVAVLGLVGCEDKAKMCAAIAETREAALQPTDRIYWDENCVAWEAERKAAKLREDQATAKRNREGW